MKEREHLENIGIDGMIIIKWNFKRWDVKAWTGLIWDRRRATVNAVMNLRVP
jgi:hypothetical protein